MMDEINQLIATSTPADIRETLDFLLNECSIDEMPSRELVIQWRDVLLQRGGKFAKIATDLCEPFLQETA